MQCFVSSTGGFRYTLSRDALKQSKRSNRQAGEGI